MTALAALHATRHAAGLSEEAARDIYERVVSKRSTKDMNDGERRACCDEIKRLYPSAKKRPSKGARRRLDGPFAAKFQALWIAMWNLGLTRDRTDEALIKFVKRQTGIDHTRWLRGQAEASAVIEALKGWMAREAQVDWHYDRLLPDWTQTNGYRIAAAQFRLLKLKGLIDHVDLSHLLISMGLPPANNQTDKSWQDAMNALGERVRGDMR
ncbi:MAG: regulatory protein GemA [Ahrensia sp.]|nr:regulatory protein GemA [Ahrensia sp.]